MANSKKGTKQVTGVTPKARVAKTWGTKAGLVDAILGLIGDAPEGSRAALMQVSNTRLMSHHHNTERMQKQFGGKDGAIRAILALRFPKTVPAGEREKLEGFTPWRLMDLHRQAQDAAKRAAKKS